MKIKVVDLDEFISSNRKESHNVIIKCEYKNIKTQITSRNINFKDFGINITKINRYNAY